MESFNNFIPYGRQYIDDDDIRAVTEVLRSGWITQGPLIDRFEEALAAYCGSKYAVVVSSGTAGLHLACLAAGLEKNDHGITSPNTFLASANCMVYCGAEPIFADIELETYNLCPNEVKNRITPETRVIVAVHFAGHPCDMKSISEIARKNGFMVIEDACHALGARYQGEKIGSCAYSDMTVFSFHPVKSITTAEGGAVTTNSRDIYLRLKELRNHGMYKDSKRFTNRKLAFTGDEVNPWYYEMKSPGYNYRITDIQCALGLNQLKKIDRFIQRRKEIAQIYSQAFSGIDWIRTPVELDGCESSWHLYVVLIDFEKIGTTRRRVMEYLKQKGIGTQVHYIPVYRQPFYRKSGETLPNTDYYYSRCLSLPLFYTLNEEQIEQIVGAILEIPAVK